MSRHFKYFVGHIKPNFPLWKDFSFFEIPKQKGTLVGSFDSNFLNHKIFNEYSFLFELNRNLRSSDFQNSLITISQYRRFVFNKGLGIQSTNLPWCRLLSEDTISTLDIKNEYLPLDGNSYLVGSAIKIPNILEQYSRRHFSRDILKFSSTLIDLEILTDEQALNFLNHNILIPSPSCGTFTLASFNVIFDTLELAARGFWNNGYRPYNDDYQCRVMSFLLERLNSYLLISYLMSDKLDIGNLTGYTTIVTPNNSKIGFVEKGLISDS